MLSLSVIQPDAKRLTLAHTVLEKPLFCRTVGSAHLTSHGTSSSSQRSLRIRGRCLLNKRVEFVENTFIMMMQLLKQTVDMISQIPRVDDSPIFVHDASSTLVQDYEHKLVPSMGT